MNFMAGDTLYSSKVRTLRSHLTNLKVLSPETIQEFADECDELINLVYQEDRDIVKDFGCILG